MTNEGTCDNCTCGRQESQKHRESRYILVNRYFVVLDITIAFLIGFALGFVIAMPS